MIALKTPVLFFIPLFISSVTFCYGAKILGIFPVPAKSHFASTGGIMKSLIDAGHEVTIVSPFARELSKDNYSSIIDLSDSFPVPISSFEFDRHGKEGVYDLIQIPVHYEKDYCERVFNTKAYQDLVFSEKISFDVIFIEVQVFYKCCLPIAKKLNAPVIGIITVRSWSFADLAMNNPHHPADVPAENIIIWRFNDFYHRLKNLWYYIVIRYVWIFEVMPTLEKFHKNHEDKLKPYEGYLDIEPVLMFYNGHHSILPRANNPNIIEIGGIQVKPAKPLPLEIQKFIDEAPHGVILFTFGSLVKVSSLPASVVNIFLEVFASLPQRVLWKYEQPLENVPDNVWISDWLPQRDILEHANVRAFISHCGLSGMYEAIYTATPVISSPLMFDQHTNAAILEHLGVAVHLDIHSISKESLSEAVNSIINDPKYHNKMQKLSRAFLDRPLTPQQSVVFWTEYVIKYKDTLNLMPPSGKLNLFQYYALDIISAVILTFFALVFFVKRVAKMLARLVRRKLSLFLQLKKKLV